MADHEAMIEEFKSITQEDDDRSRFYLESANWQLPVALSSFFDATQDPEVVHPPVVELPSDEDTSGRDPSPMDMEYDEIPVRDVSAPVKKTDPPARRNNSNLRSLADYAGASNRDSSDEEGQEFYTGGSEHSGEVIVGPGRKKRGEDIVKKMFKDAKRHGAVPVEESSSSATKKAPTYFTGGGYKLGETDTDHEFVPGQAKPEGRRKLDVVLKLWRNGFTVGDGQLRDYQDTENREFLQAIMKGEIPQELLKLAKGGEVSLDMEDHKTEEYKPVKPKMKAFTGEGHTLGGISPTVVSSMPPKPEETSSVDPPVIVDEDSPVTTIRIQLGDGTRVTQKFNHSHTVAQVYSFVRQQYPTDRNFVLMTTFPNKELSEDEKSLKEENLLNAVIVQRLK